MLHAQTPDVKERKAPVGRLVLALAMVLLAVLPVWRTAAQDDAPIPVTQTIAQGVDLMPQVAVSWRVLASTAELREDAPFADRTLGFVLGNEGEVLVTDEVSEDQVVVAPGEASFHREGVSQQRASLEEEPAPYYAIELIVADAAEDESTIGDSELILATNEFTAPENTRELSLQRTVLDAGATFEVVAGEGQGLIVITDGDLEATAAEDTRPFQEGGAAGFTGSLDIEAGEDGATMLVASIGQEVEPPPTPEPTEEPVETGTLTVTLYDCPEGSDPTEDASDCEVADDASGVFVADIDAPDDSIEGEVDGGAATFAELPDATYALFGLREEGDQRLLFGAPPVEVGQENLQVTVEAGDEVAVDIYRYPDPAAETGTLIVSIFDCPEGADPTAGETDDCAVGADDFGASMQNVEDQGQSAGEEFTLGNAAQDGDAFLLNDLPAGTYALLGFGPVNPDVAVYAAPPAEGTQSGYVVEVPAGETVELAVYRFMPESGGGTDTGTLSFVVYECPEGADPTVDASECAAGDDPYLFYVFDPETETIAAFTDDGERDLEAYLLELDPGTYGIGSDNLPEGATFAVGGDANRTDDGPQVTVVAGETSSAIVYVYVPQQ